MYFKIAYKNILKNKNHYIVYMITLILSIIVFYTFNNLNPTQILDGKTSEIYILLKNGINMTSKIVVVIILFLLLYANNFLIKKRNNEFATYMILGMKKSKVAKIMLYETFIVGFFSLIIGTIIAIFTSGSFNNLTNTLIEQQIVKKSIIDFSFLTFLKTSFYFFMIFTIISFFNVIKLKKYKIITLLNEEYKIEYKKNKNSLLTFILSIILLITSYYLLHKNGIEFNSIFSIIIILGMLGTILFYKAFINFIINIIKKLNLYYKKDNFVVINQIKQKLNTNYLTIGMISLLLFLSILLLGSGFGFKKTMDDNLKKSLPYDISLIKYNYEDENVSIESILKQNNITISDANYNEISEYLAKEKIADIFPELTRYKKTYISLLKLSDYEKLINKNIDLKENEVILTTNVDDIYNDKKMYENREIKLFDQKMKIISSDFLTYYNSGGANNVVSFIVNDKYLLGQIPISNILNIDYNNDAEINANNLENTIKKYNDSDDNEYFILPYCKEVVIKEILGSTTLILFILLYLSFVFIITSFAILSLHQLNLIIDNKKTYNILTQLGNSNKDNNKIILKQNIIYFTLPIILVIINASIGFYEINIFLRNFNKPNILPGILITVGLFLIVYMIYFIITYLLAKQILKENIKK